LGKVRKQGHPYLRGAPIRISTYRDLRTHGGNIVSGYGTPVHAATFIRKRKVVLDADLLADDRELKRILIHELFHFAWVRLGNAERLSFERLMKDQFASRGELGWSSEYRKRELTPGNVHRRDRKWREYCCEAFCDTAAAIYGDVGRHSEFTLGKDARRQRIEWFGEHLGSGCIRI
jgi:hypothetical protein